MGVSEDQDQPKEVQVFRIRVLRVRMSVAGGQGQKWIPNKE